MGITDDVKKILEIKIKPRQDSYTDQFSRIFLLKVMFVGALFTGLNWNDRIKCLIPGNFADGGFVSSSCWINGVYVYENVRYHDNELGYYGMPRDIRHDGIYSNGKLCETDSSATNVKGISRPDCIPMKKTFYLQYQYMTFFMLLVGALYYAPYTFFKLVNTDIQALKSSIKADNAQSIYNSFFNREVNPTSSAAYRVFGNVISKILYIVVNVLGFVLTDQMFFGKFRTYGTEYAKWSNLNNTMSYDYMGRRHSPKPGDVLIPSFAFCEVYELAEDIKNNYANRYRFICEMGQHVLYQYAFLIVWWAMICGILLSVLGLVILIADYAFTFVNMKKNIPGYSYMGLTVRECEYLDYLRKKKLSLFGEVLEVLRTERGKQAAHSHHTRPPIYTGNRHDDVY